MSILNELRDQLEILPIGELRAKATKNFGIKLSRDDTKDDIINRIVGVASKQNFAQEAKGDLPEPGWTRIMVAPMPGRSQFPFYSCVNGYQCWIPINYEVDVPHKIVAMLGGAKEEKRVSDESGNETVRLEASYPYSVIYANPGPDPRPGLEVARERKLAAKREFAELEGYWPKDHEIKERRAELSRARLLKEAIHSKD